MFRPNPHRTRDATHTQIKIFFLWCCLPAVWTPPFTSTGRVALRVASHVLCGLGLIALYSSVCFVTFSLVSPPALSMGRISCMKRLLCPVVNGTINREKDDSVGFRRFVAMLLLPWHRNIHTFPTKEQEWNPASLVVWGWRWKEHVHSSSCSFRTARLVCERNCPRILGLKMCFFLFFVCLFVFFKTVDFLESVDYCCGLLVSETFVEINFHQHTHLAGNRIFIKYFWMMLQQSGFVQVCPV